MKKKTKMAKRLLLSDKNKKRPILTTTAAERYQSYFKNPNVNKLLYLDDEMKEIANNKSMPIDEKVKLFDEKLAEFKALKSRLEDQGQSIYTTSTKKEPLATNRQLLIPIIKDILKDILEGKESGIEEDEDEEDPNQYLLETPTKPQQQQQDAKRKRLQFTATTPDNNKKEDHETNNNNNNDADEMDAKLQAHGFRRRGDYIMFSPRYKGGTPARKALGESKGRQRKYLHHTYMKVLRHIFSKHVPQTAQRKPLRRWNYLIDSIYETIKNNPAMDLDLMLEKYPVLREHHKSKREGIQFHGWTNLPEKNNSHT